MTDQKILIIFNPRAGKTYRPNYRLSFENQLKSFLPQASCDWLETNYDLNRQLLTLNLNAYAKIIVIGGDGTVKQAAEFILKNNLNVPLAIIPQGSANVLAGSLGIPRNEQRAIEIAALGKTRAIDVGLINNEHYFLVGLSVGLISEAILQTGLIAKNRWGILAYLITLLKQKTTAHSLFKFTIDGQNYEVSGNTLLITNTFSMFGVKPRSFSEYTDGVLELTVAKNKSIWGILPMAVFTWLNKNILPLMFVRTGRLLTISEQSLAGQCVQVDGEPLSVKKIEATIVPQKLKVITK